jgi:hypothetical protein
MDNRDFVRRTTNSTSDSESGAGGPMRAAMLHGREMRSPHASNPEVSLDRFILLCWCSFARNQRGQHLHAHQYLGAAVDVLLLLVREHDSNHCVRTALGGTPRRRLEERDPKLAQQLMAITLHIVECPEATLMDLCEEVLRTRAPHLCWNQFTQSREALFERRNQLAT